MVVTIKGLAKTLHPDIYENAMNAMKLLLGLRVLAFVACFIPAMQSLLQQSPACSLALRMELVAVVCCARPRGRGEARRFMDLCQSHDTYYHMLADSC